MLHMRRKDMQEYREAGLHHAEFYIDQVVVEWGVYKWTMRRGRGQEARARWDKLMKKMWKEWVAQWGIRRKKPRRSRGVGAVQEKVLDRGEGDKVWNLLVLKITAFKRLFLQKEPVRPINGFQIKCLLN